jgi:hypothetical protein
MIKQKILLLAAIVAALIHRLAPFRSLRSSRLKPAIVLSNIAEGTHQSSAGITYEADVAITERFLLVKRGGAANRIAI